MRCTGELHIVSMWPALPLIPSDRLFTCLRSRSCAGSGLRGLVAPFLHAARLDTLELYTEKELTVERDTVAGGLRLPGMGASELCEAALWVKRAHVRSVALEHFTVSFCAFLCVL